MAEPGVHSSTEKLPSRRRSGASSRRRRAAAPRHARSAPINRGLCNQPSRAFYESAFCSRGAPDKFNSLSDIEAAGAARRIKFYMLYALAWHMPEWKCTNFAGCGIGGGVSAWVLFGIRAGCWFYVWIY